MNSKTHIIIVAAGSGNRFGGDLPKQFRMVGDRMVLMETIIRMGRALPKADITVVLAQEYIGYWEKCCESCGLASPRIVAGGATRWESVRNALAAIAPEDDSIVVIHDGARPVIRTEMVRRVIDGLNDGAPASIPVIAVTDSLREIGDNGTSTAFDRSRVVAVQTPQAFTGAAIKKGYEQPYCDAFTDDATVVQTAGYPAPVLVEGSPLNIKITRPRDLEIAAVFLATPN